MSYQFQSCDTKVVKKDASCSLLGNQIYMIDIGQVNPVSVLYISGNSQHEFYITDKFNVW